MKQRFNVTGMTCSACSAHVQGSVYKLSGVEKADVNLLTNSMTVEYDAQKVTSNDIIRAVEKAGYGAYTGEKKARGSQTGKSGRGRSRRYKKAADPFLCFSGIADVYQYGTYAFPSFAGGAAQQYDAVFPYAVFAAAAGAVL